MSFRDDVEALNAKFIDYWNRGDAAGCVALYTEDAVFLTGTAELRGRCRHPGLFRRGDGRRRRTEAPDGGEREADGNLGFAIDAYTDSAGTGSRVAGAETRRGRLEVLRGGRERHLGTPTLARAAARSPSPSPLPQGEGRFGELPGIQKQRVL